MTQPLISIVLCCYNGERFIKQQIDSLLSQTYPNIEIIISDDASTDGSVKILEDYKGDPRVQLIFQPTNLGPSKNFEFAVQKTRGEVIAFSDQDDIWLPEKVERLYSAIGDSYLVYCDSELVNEKGEKLNKKISDLKRMYTGNETAGFILFNVVWGHAMMIKRDLLELVLPIPGGIPHDIWIAFKAATITGIKYLDIPLTLYRQHESAATKTIAVKAKPRTMAKRYADFRKQLHWIEVMCNNERPVNIDFYNRLFNLYQRKQNERWVWQLFFFLLAHRKKIFMFTRKGWLSQVVEMFKQAKGVSA
jgi:glycosyltransferase involved in cell wall biosynthesis